MKVTIAKVNSPVWFEALRDHKSLCPVTGLSYVNLDNEINKYYATYDILPDPASISRTGEIVIVRLEKDRRFYRARVETLLQRSTGYDLLLYLVDTAKLITTPIRCVRPIDQQFVAHTHQAVVLRLPGINPCSRMLDINTMKSGYRESHKWDTSATLFIKNLLKNHSGAQFETMYTSENGELFGKLYLTNGKDKICVNERLVEENYGMRLLNIEGVQVLDSEASFSDESENSSELSLGASAQCLYNDRHVRTPSPASVQPTGRLSGLKELYKMQQDLDRKAQEIDPDEFAHSSPIKMNSTNYQGRRPVVAKVMTPPRIPAAALATLVRPRCSSSPKHGKESLVLSHSPPQLLSSPIPDIATASEPFETPRCSSSPKEKKHGIQSLLPSRSPLQSFSPTSSVTSSGSRCVSRGTQYDPPSKKAETNVPVTVTAPVSPRNIPTSRPASSIEQMISRVQKALNKKATSQTSMDSKTITKLSPTLPELESNPKPVVPLSKVESVKSPSQPETPTLQKPETLKAEVDSRSIIVQKSENPLPKSLNNRVPFGRGYPLKYLNNPQAYARPGSSASSISTSISPLVGKSAIERSPTVKNKKKSRLALALDFRTSTENDSAKASIHCPSTSVPGTSFSYTMVDPFGLSEGVCCRKILICGKLPTKPDLNMPKLFNTIEKSLSRMGIKSPSIIQSYAWPAILRGRNIAVVSGPQSGKSMTYLAALITKLLDRASYSKLPPGNEPLALVVCSSWRSANRVFDLCQSIISGVGGVRALLIHGGGYDETQKIELLNGCEILIATPCALLRLLSIEGTKPTSLDRLCHFVLDDADVLTEEFTEQLKRILHEYTAVLKKRNVVDIPSQIMAFSTKWTKGVKSFIGNVMPNPLLFCASFHESIIYAGIKISMHTFPDNEKQNYFMELVKPNLIRNDIKTVICTVSAEVADSLYKMMSYVSKHVLVAHEDLTRGHIKAVCDRWNDDHAKGHFPILIATDASLDELNIEDAKCLIHYDIPELSKSQFGFRFSCLLKYMRNPSIVDAANPKSNPECMSHIITTEKCVLQAHALISLMERLSCEIPPALKSLAEGFYRGREENKQPVPLCYYLKAFGQCPNRYWCKDRHMLLKDVDKPRENLPRGSIVRVCILDVRNASHFYGRIAKYQLQDGTWEDGYEIFMQLNVDLNTYFANHLNRVPHGLSKIGDICAVHGDDVSYYRVRILTSPTDKTSNALREVGVVFIDVGSLSTVAVSSLLKLPSKLQTVPPQAIEIFLANIKPVDKDQEFTIKAYRYAQDLVLNNETVGTVALSLGSTLWLKNIIKQTKLAGSGEYVYDFNFRKKLNGEFTIDNPEHLPKLEKLCSGIFELPNLISIPIPNETHLPVEADTNDIASYAFLPLDAIELVSITSVFTPGRFYLTKRPSLDCLEQLMDDLTKYFQEKSPTPVTYIYQGMLCAAKCSETNDYYRSRVLEILQKGPEPSSEDDITVFWADYGENHTVKRTDVFALPNNLLTKLPLQAIECSLANVVPVGDSWTENASNFMWEQQLKEDGSYKELFVNALQKLSSPKQIGNRYEVELYDPSDHITDVSFADLLCEANHAKLAPIEEPEVVAVEHGEHRGLANGFNEHEDLDSCNAGHAKLAQFVEPEVVAVEHGEHRGLANGFNEHEDLDSCNADHAKLAQFVEPEVVDRKHERAVIAENMEDQDEHPILTNGFDEHDNFDPSAELLPSENPKYNEDLDYHSTVTPMITWWDTKTTIHLKIMILGVKKQFIGLQPSHLLYRATVNNILHLIDVNLFNEIEHEKFNSSISENFVKITITKKTLGKWPRLRNENTKTRWITVDYDHVTLNSSDEEETFDAENFEWNKNNPDKPKTNDVKRSFCPLDEAELQISDSDSNDSDCSDKYYHDDNAIF